MKQLIALAILTLPLMAFSCEGPEAQSLYQTVFGETAAQNVALVLSEELAEEEVSVAYVAEPETVVVEAIVEPVVVEPEPYVEPVAEAVVEPPAPPCDNYTWRGRVYDCNGAWLYDL